MFIRSKSPFTGCCRDTGMERILCVHDGPRLIEKRRCDDEDIATVFNRLVGPAFDIVAGIDPITNRTVFCNDYVKHQPRTVSFTQQAAPDPW